MCKILTAVFGVDNVCSLLDFLNKRWKNHTCTTLNQDSLLVNQNSPLALTRLLNETLVAFSSKSVQEKQPIPKPREPGFNRNQTEIINCQIERILQSGKLPKNILALGYRHISGHSIGAMTLSKSLESYFPNTLTGTLKTYGWNLLLERIGDLSMGYLLSETSIFIKMPNGCLCQVTGAPLYTFDTFNARLNLPPFFVIPFNSDAVSIEKSENYSKLSQHSFISEVKSCIPSKRKCNALLANETCSVDYSNQIKEKSDDKKPKQSRSRKRRKKSVKSAVETDTTLNSDALKSSVKSAISPSLVFLPWSNIFYSRPSLTHRNIQRHGFPESHLLCLLMQDRNELVLALSRSIFPIQHRLPSPILETCISQSKRNGKSDNAKIKKRLQRIRALDPLLDMILTKCKKCNYKALLDYHCPLPKMVDVKDGVKRILDMHIKQQQVSSFVKSVLKHIIPNDIWGDDSNRDAFMAVVVQLVSLRRYEVLSLQNIGNGIKISKMAWLTSGIKPALHLSTCEAEKQRQMLYEFLYWLFADVVVSLIKTNFYATDTVPFKNRVFYFRHETWSRINQSLQSVFKRNLLKPIEMPLVTSALAGESFHKALGFSTTRLIPKESGARMIMNLGRKPKPKELAQIGLNPEQIKQLMCYRYNGENLLSINQLLTNAHHVLTLEKTEQSDLMKTTMLGLDDIYTRFKAFKLGLVAASADGSIPQLYCCKMDIASCFDTINQDKLLSLLQSFLTKTDYVIQKYAVLYASGDRIRRVFQKRARDAANFQTFTEFVEDASATVKQTVFVDQVEYRIEAAESIKDLLKSHIQNNFIKIGKKFFCQSAGIPQGSIVSIILCSFFYAHFEKSYLADLIMDSSETLLLRYIDDFLFVTTKKDKAQQFMEIMHKAHPEFGCSVNISKSLSNFSMSLLDGRAIPETYRDFPWCGFVIDLKRLEIKNTLFQNRSITYVADSLSVNISQNPGKHLRSKLFQYIKAKCHPIFLDTKVNSVFCVLSNIYDNFCSAAMRFCSYLNIAFDGKIYRNAKFIVGVVEDAVCFGAHIMHNRTRRSIAVLNSCEFRISTKEIHRIGLGSFIFILGRRQGKFSKLVQSLCELYDKISISEERKQLHSKIQSRWRASAPKAVY
ncbi:Telomerase reverse transcriptase [Batrachochytrium dendrobatidis]|nr:Telomerase reverse transcriptase [Batrachochytrium dendrobatidis]KAK5671995.1 Telomerase reverse transcriptase [Batrachochytrium dendrobatidis]